MLLKGIIHILISLLFLSRLVPKYLHYRDTEQVRLFGHVWEGGYGLMVLVVIAIITIVLLGFGIRNFKEWFDSRRDTKGNT